MPRQAIPDPFAIGQFGFRMITLLWSLGCFTISLWISINCFHTNHLLYLALGCMVILDNLEILALTRRHGDGMVRMKVLFLVTLELIAVAALMLACFLESVNPFKVEDSHLRDQYKDLARNLISVQWYLAYGIIGLHSLLVLICVVDEWAHTRWLLQ